MFQNQIVNQVVDWERRLEIEEERRKYHRGDEPYVNYLAAPVPCHKERKSPFAWFIRLLHLFRRPARPTVPCYGPECRRETLPG